MIQIIGVEGLEFADLCAAHLGKQLVSDLLIGLADNFAGLGIDHGMSKDSAQQVIIRNTDPLQARLFDVTNVLGVDPLIAADDDITVFVRNIESGLLAAQTISDQIHLGAFWMQRK